MYPQKTLSMPQHEAASLLSILTEQPVESDVFEKRFGFGKDDLISPLQLREIHATLRPDRASHPQSIFRPSPDRKPVSMVVHFTKGGVGKTTVLANVALEMARFGIKILVIDADPQGTSSSLFGIDTDDEEIRTLYSIFFTHNGVKTDVDRAVIPLYSDAVLDILPSDLGMSGFDMAATPQARREYLFERLLSSRSEFFSKYDMILIDTNPGSNLLNQNLMIGANVILVPVALDILSTKSMKLMVQEIAEVQDLSPRERPLMIVANMNQVGTVHSKASLDHLKSSYPSSLLETVIPTYAGFKRQGWGSDASAPQLLMETEATSPAGRVITKLSYEITKRTLLDHDSSQ